VEISCLVSKGFDINAFDDLNRAPLHYAVEENQYEAAQLLLSLGADVNGYEDDKIGETPLNIAAQGIDPKVVVLLLKHGANPDMPGWMGQTARFRASRRNDEAGRRIAAIIEAGG
jgi:ankyrin repeat protein